MQFLQFYYLDLHFLQFPISLLVACLLACCLIPAPPKTPLAPLLCPPSPHPPNHHPQTSPRSSLYFSIVYSDQYAHPPQCTVPLCTVQPFFDFVPVLWSQYHGLFAMVPALWSLCYGPSACLLPPPSIPYHIIKPHLDLVFIVTFFTLISMLTPLQCNSPPPHSSTPYFT